MATILTPARRQNAEVRAGNPNDLIWRLSVEQYHQMIHAGILSDGDPVELLDGFLVYKMSKSPRHSVVCGLISDFLAKLCPKGWHVRLQDPVTTDTSEPEPDVAVIRGKRADYLDRHPAPEDSTLVVEVSDSSLRRDRGWKRLVYARAGVPTYWIANLVQNRMEIFSGPKGRGTKADYPKPAIYEIGDDVPVILDGKELGRIAVKDLLP